MTDPTFKTWDECVAWAKAGSKAAQTWQNHDERRERIQWILSVKAAHKHLKGQDDGRDPTSPGDNRSEPYRHSFEIECKVNPPASVSRKRADIAAAAIKARGL